MDFDSLPADAPAQPAQNQAPPSFDQLKDDSATALSFDSLQDDSQKYGTPSQQALAGLEGAAQGYLGPLATLGETKLLGVPEQDIAGRAAANPVTHGVTQIGGLTAGFMTGTGEAGLIAKGAQAVLPAALAAKNAGLAAKVGAGIIKGFIENGLIQGGDEISNAMLGVGDPEAPVSSALAHMGAAGVLGAGVGGVFGGVGYKLKALADAKAGAKAAQAIEDFGNRWEHNTTNPTPHETVPAELESFYNSTKEMVDDLWGSTGVKSETIDKLAQKVSPEAVTAHVDEIERALNNAPEALQKEKLFQEAVNAWKQKTGTIIDPVTLEKTFQPAASDVFKATENLKKELGFWANPKRGGAYIPPSEMPFINAAKSIGGKLKLSLENSSHWGELGDLQKSLNKAASKFIPALADFESKFTGKLLGERTLDPGKINTYLNQLGKANAELKQSAMKTFIESAENFRDEIGGVHHALGLESPVLPSSLNAVKGTFGEVTPGAELADYLFNTGLSGSLTHERIPQYLAKIIGKPIDFVAKKYVVPTALKVLGSDSAGNIMEALDYANHVNSGVQKITTGVEGLFKSGSQQAVELETSEKNREKLKEFIKKGGVNSQIQEHMQEQNRTIQSDQKFAEGGSVGSGFTKSPQEGDLFKGTKGISEAMPAQNILLQTARGRVSNYLHSISPQPQPGLPFDRVIPNKKSEHSYNRALDLANQPLSVLNDIKKGTLTSEKMKHFTQMYPELYSHLSKKIMTKISEQQANGERPSAKTRQSLGVFLGAPVGSSMTPASIQSIQSVFAKGKSQKEQQTQQATESKTNKLPKLSTNLQTPDQARTQRMVKG